MAKSRKSSDESLVLMPIPLREDERNKLQTKMALRLKDVEIATLVDYEVAKVYNWQKEKDPVKKRMLRNYSLVYTQQELTTWAIATIKKILEPRYKIKSVNNG